MMRKIDVLGSVRVDLLGGTIDIPPIGLILKNAMTLNVATSLKTSVSIEESSFLGVEIHSVDYQKKIKVPKNKMSEDILFYTEKYAPFHFVLQILFHFQLVEKIKITLSSSSIPTGSGLGGSSAMGVVLALAILKYQKRDPLLEKKEIIKIVNAIESRILKSGPAGIQDYFPALYGGVLALRETAGGIEVEQLYQRGLVSYLKNHLILVYSGKTRLSGINNWEVYKGFFDKKKNIVDGLGQLAQLSYQTYQMIKKGNYADLWKMVKKEGEIRENLFKKILTPAMKKVKNDLKKEKINGGLKVCGAGGGGCFLIAHDGKKEKEIYKILNKHQMQVLCFDIDNPID